ncbi:MAG: alanine racemase [Clostridia bacterium]|nr:alanine racemase [Clostridia bacterium]
MENIYLSDLCSFLKMKFDFPNDFRINNVSTDTRTIQSGDVFLALIGEKHDGHNYIKTALDKGASVLVVCDEYSGECKIPVLKVPDTLKALAQLATCYRKKLNIKIVAVTGSSGKTTTKNMISKLLSSKYKVLSTYKNLNNQIGLPISIFQLTSKHEVVVLELGMNHVGEISELSQIAGPNIAVITNIGSAHIGNLGSVENILKAKLEIIEGLDPQNGLLILNGDDKRLCCTENIPYANVLFAGTDGTKRNHVYADSIETLNDGMSFDLVNEGVKTKIFMPIHGNYNINNALLAITCALQMGISVEDIRDTFHYFVNESLRNEEYIFNGVMIVKDYYNANPEAMKAALTTLKSYRNIGKKIAILGEMNELGTFSPEEHLRLGELCREMTDVAFFVGDNYQDFAKGYSESGHAFKTKEELYICLKKYIISANICGKDVILIKGSRSIKMEDVFEKIKKYLNMDYSEDSFEHFPSSATKMYVDVSAMQNNIRRIKNAVSKEVEVMPIIKANAYGCGTDIVVNAFRFCKYLAVADVKEAVILKRIFPDKKIMILYQPDSLDIPAIIENNFIVGIGYYEFAEKLNECASADRKIRIHVEIDTGAGRLGVNPDCVSEFAKKVKKLKNVVVEGLYMHYVVADSTKQEDIEFTEMQTRIFTEAIHNFKDIYGKVRFIHASSSVPIFTQKQAHFNMVRPGYMIYGYYPSESLTKEIKLAPVLQLSTRILQIKTVPSGTSISYGRTFITKRESVIATVAIGYADGLSRLMSNRGFFVVNGQRAPIVGRMCMDLTMLDITDIVGNVNVGDEVFIFDNVNVTLNDVAEWSNTIGYEVLTHIEDKVERIEKV